MNEQNRAASALMHLDAGCPREEWVKAGMAAKAAGLGFDDFHSWSASAGNYAGENDCRNVWKSFSDTGPVTANSLFAMAYAQGWQDPAKRQQVANGTGIALPIAAHQKTFTPPLNQAGSAKAADVWACCIPVTPSHEYIVRKQGIADGLRVYPNDAPTLVIRGQNVAGFLVVPCYDLGGNLQTLQFIPGKGDKLNLSGASFGNGCHVVGNIAESRRVFVVEGIGQAWAVWKAAGCAAVVCFGAGRMATVAAALHGKYPLARVVLIPDRGKENQAAEIACALNGQWCELPQDKPSNYDANDFMQDYGVEALTDLLERTKVPPMRFNLLSGADLCNAPPMRWMVRGILPTEGLAALFGASGSGKSFLTLDIAAAIAGGARAWFSRRVTQCPVTYACLEGEQGMGKRIKAWSEYHNTSVPDALRFITQPFNLLNDDDVSELAKAVQAAGNAKGLVILDTLHRAASGADENSSADMGNIITAAKRLQSLVGGLVLLIHHTGKDQSKGLRGHSSLHAALDAAIEVTKTGSRREWAVAKSKDDDTGTAHAFKLHIVTVGIDDDGTDVTSCVVIADDSGETTRRVKLPQGGNQAAALMALAEPLKTSKQFNKPGAMPGRPCLEMEDAVIAIANRLTCESKRKNERARQALQGLIQRGIIETHEGWIWRCD